MVNRILHWYWIASNRKQIEIVLILRYKLNTMNERTNERANQESNGKRLAFIWNACSGRLKMSWVYLNFSPLSVHWYSLPIEQSICMENIGDMNSCFYAFFFQMVHFHCSHRIVSWLLYSVLILILILLASMHICVRFVVILCRFKIIQSRRGSIPSTCN